jgi:UDP-2,3-diacylglucosamine hydrolase
VRTRIISDVHLGLEEWPKLERLKRTLDGAEDLVLLGDIFNYWVGARQVEAPAYAALADHLAGMTRRGVTVSFIPGNRDFMVDRRFAKRTGVRLEERVVRRRFGKLQAHLEHGDYLFNRNFKYFAYRRLEKFRMLKEAVNDSPGWVLNAIGRSLRRVSRATTPYVRLTEKEIRARARPFFEDGCDVVICGHIHQPQKLQAQAGGSKRTILVLGDWDQDCTYAEFDGTDFHLRSG